MRNEEGRTRLTLNRVRGDKWSVHIDGVRKPGLPTNEALAIVQRLLEDETRLYGVIIQTMSRLPDVLD